jgi:hypothetical protein
MQEFNVLVLLSKVQRIKSSGQQRGANGSVYRFHKMGRGVGVFAGCAGGGVGGGGLCVCGVCGGGGCGGKGGGISKDG